MGRAVVEDANTAIIPTRKRGLVCNRVTLILERVESYTGKRCNENSSRQCHMEEGNKTIREKRGFL